MESLFKKPRRAKRVYRVECLNSDAGISQSIRKSENEKYVVCLCLATKTIKTAFPDILGALDQMGKNRKLYKQKKSK